MNGVAMARPKKKKAETKTIAVRSSLAWVAWLEEGAEFCRTDTSKLIDAALVDYLQAKGFTKRPPKRTP